MRLDRKTLVVLACLSIPAVAGANGCVSNTATEPNVDASTPGYDGGAPPGIDSSAPGRDATVPDTGPILEDATPPADTSSPPDVFDAGPQALIRVAWFDDVAFSETFFHKLGDGGAAGPRYDACVAIHGTGAWQGPLLASAGSPGLALFDVSAYFSVPPAQYDVRIVPGGSTSCDLPDAGEDAGLQTTDFTNLPAVAANGFLTVVTMPNWESESTGSINVVGLVDEATTSAGTVNVRFANVSPQSALDFGLGGGDVFTPLFTTVSDTALIISANDDAGTNAGVDTNGYLQVSPFTQIDTSIQVSGSDYGFSASIDAPAGTVLSAFAVYDAVGSFDGVIVCYDGQAPVGSPFLTKCTPVQPPNPTGDVLRFTNFLADPSFEDNGIDFCVKYHSIASYGPSSIGGPAEQGTTFGAGTERYDLHAGFTYDIRVVTGGAPDCSTSVTPDIQFVAPTVPGTLSTMVLTGYVAALDGGSPVDDGGGLEDGGGLASTAFAAITLTDLGCNETPPAVRIVNVAAPVAGPQSAELIGGPAWTFPSIPYGAVGTPSPVGLDGGVDPCGYLPFAGTGAGGLTLATHNEDSQYTNTDQTETLYLFSPSASFVEVLACDDNDPTDTACFVLEGGG